MKSFVRNSFEHMLQGLAYWLAYKGETYKCTIVEADAITEAVQILSSQLPSGYKVVKEFSYGNISKSYGGKRADLAILNADKECECLVEFKLADAKNGGYVSDVKKMSIVKKGNLNIDCYVIILYRKSCKIDVPKKLVDDKGKAKRKVNNMPNLTVRRVCNAIRSQTAKNMKKVICLEVL